MNDFEQKILQRLEHLENEIETLKTEKSAADAATEFERLPMAATVGKDYVAYRFGCTEEAVVRGRAKTDRLKKKRVSHKPLKWIKRDVDAVWREITKSPSEKALDAIEGAKTVRRRRSIITKREAA